MDGVAPPVGPVIWLALACTQSVPDTGPAPEASCAQSYAGTGQPLLATYCTTCHGQTAQQGGVRLDTLEHVRANAERADARVVEGTMPPGGGLLPHEVDALHAWLACGAPGQAQAPVVPAVTDDPDTGVELSISVQELGDGRYLVVGVDAYTGALWSEDLWVLQGGELALEERVRPVGGDLITDRWSPPVRVFSPDQSSWTQQVERSRVDGSGEDVWTESWSATRWQQVDARALVKDDVRGFQITEADGASITVLFAGTTWLARQSWDPIDGVEIWHQSQFFDATPNLLDDGAFWQERALAWQ